MSTLPIPKNEGSIDRVLRVAVGVALLGLVFAGPETSWGLLGLIPLVTGALGVCPLYKLFGVQTCAGDESCES